MTDKELLELAAKAAGIVGTWELDTAYVQERYYFNVPYDNHNMLTGFEWNPLREDGDALRLAVKLGIDFYEGDDDGRAAYAGYYAGNANTRRQKFMIERHDAHADPYAATRRAIVRSAAEIGKAMP